MSLESLLSSRQSEHEALFQRILTLLQTDQRVVAAWLFGSCGRGTADIFSDLDLWIVVKDEAIEEVCAERRAYAARVGETVLLFESAHNTPKDGGYLMALYAGQVGIQQVDWYWQKQTDASLPRQALVLFNHGDIPQDTRLEQLDPPGAPEPDSLMERMNSLNKFFWVMANIAVKSMVRRQTWAAINHLEGLRGLVDDTKRLLELSSQLAGREEWRITLLPPVEPLEQLAMLREITTEMEQLTPEIQKQGGQVEVAAIPSIYTGFRLAESLMRQDMSIRQREQ